MYSGSDSTGSQNYNQWPLNPAAYQNTPNEQIDWAALAQQWIIMKEAGPPVPDQIPVAPPPPSIQVTKKENVCEGGEAPMEVVNEKDEDNQAPWNDNASNDGNWNWNQQQHWGWGNTWSAPAGVPPPSAAKAPLLPTPPPYSQYSGPSENSGNFGGYNRPTNEYSGGYWTANSNKMKPHNKRYSKINVAPRPTVPPIGSDPVMLDANKRKQLPAWIREGLEKMERDKQKQIEKEREKQQKEDNSSKSKLNEEEALEIIKSTVKERERSRFESDGETSENDVNNRERKSATPEPTMLSQDELMLKVRRSMTEILLKVTNQEIRAVCKEEFQRHLRKHKASDLRVSASGGTNLSARLGVGIYGDSGSSSEGSGDEIEQSKPDSDIELKDTIKRRKAEFSKTEREIEERLAAAEKHNDEDSKGGTPKADNCDSQVDAKSQGYRTRSNEDVPSKQSSQSSKRHKNRRASTSSSARSDSEYEKRNEQRNRKTRTKKSSSSEDDYNHKSTKARNKRNNSSKDHRSVTPEKLKKEKSKRDDHKKHSESSSSKSSSTRSRKSRSKSVEIVKRKRSPSTEHYRKRKNNKNYYSHKSHSRSSSRSRRSRSYTRSHRSESRSHSHSKSEKSRRSRSRTRSERSHRSRSRTRSERSRRSESRDKRSRSTERSRRTSYSRRRSPSYSPRPRSHRRMRSRSTSRGKRSHRH